MIVTTAVAEQTQWIIKHDAEKDEYILYAPTVSIEDILDENNNSIEPDPSAWKETAIVRGTMKECLDLLVALEKSEFDDY